MKPLYVHTGEDAPGWIMGNDHVFISSYQKDGIVWYAALAEDRNTLRISVGESRDDAIWVDSAIAIEGVTPTLEWLGQGDQNPPETSVALWLLGVVVSACWVVRNKLRDRVEGPSAWDRLVAEE